MATNNKNFSRANSTSTMLQLLTILLSAAGIAFSVRNYVFMKGFLGEVESKILLDNLWIQIDAVIVINAIVCFIIYNIYTKKINRLRHSVHLLTESNYSAEIPFTSENSELGGMAFQIKSLKEKLLRLEDSKKDIEVKSREEKRKLVSNLSEQLGTKITNIVNTINSSAAKGTSHTSELSEQQNNNIKNITEGSQYANDNVSAAATATTTIYSYIKEIQQQIAKSSDITKTAAKKSEEASNKVSSLSLCSEKIGAVISIINSLSEQINLLSINATIEAARAGDAGKGFAIVASEIKNLATHTAKATEQIYSAITSIQSETSTSISSVQEINSSIREIEFIAASIINALEKQSFLAQNLTKNVEEAANSTSKISNNIIELKSSVINSQPANDIQECYSKLINESESLSEEINKLISNIQENA
ncbi:MAG: hypothetical protein K0R98_1039 [Rickettsiaceae bacterium]|jgi:methyl-accepting chemotaxis protein|nr:hypothetical protein [Rickettsiaceae bacterium]